MASFTDSIPQFNPYVQQLPVEDMAKVGMHKQQKYEEGVQKIQSDIEKIAGLDIMRDVDKAYLQSKLNQLGSNLRPFMASDFSDFQLQNSVAGMTSAIGDDPNIQTAVNSTAFYRKQKELMEKAISEGKSAIQNQWDFSVGVNDWMNNPELGKSFNKRYTQYIDVEEKWLKVFKELHPDLTEQDIPYVRNADGTLNYNKTAAAMQRVSKETVSAAKIENALRASMSPDEMNQLSIDGRFQFRGYNTPEELALISKGRFEKYFTQLDYQTEKLKGMLELSSSNPKEQDDLKNSLSEIEAQKQKLTEQMQEEIAMIQANPEQAKATIYKNSAIAQFANAHSWETNKINLLENPILKAEQWERTHQFDREKHNWTKFKDQHSMKMDELKYKLDYEKHIADTYGTLGEFSVYGGLDTKVKDPIIAMTDQMNEKYNTADAILNEMVKSGKYADKNAWLKAIDEYDGDKSKIPAEWRTKVEQYKNLVKEANVTKLGLEKAKSDVENSPEVRQKLQEFNQKLNSIPVGNIVINAGKAGEIVYSKKELFDFLQKAKYEGGSARGVSAKKAILHNGYTEKEKRLFRLLDEENKNLTGTPTIQNALNKFRPLQLEYSEFSEQKEEKVKDLLLERTKQFLPMLQSITVSEKEGASSRARYEGLAMNLLMNYNSEGFAGITGGTDKMSPDQVATYRDWLKESPDKKTIQYKKLIQGDQTFLVMVKGNEEAVIPVPSYLTGQLPQSPNSPSDSYRKILYAIDLGNGNTNAAGNVNNSFYQRYDFPQIKNVNVTADLKKVRGEENKVLINLNLKLDSGWKNIQLDDYPMSINNVETFVNKLSDAEVKQLYLQSPDVPQAWKEEIQKL